MLPFGGGVFLVVGLLAAAAAVTASNYKICGDSGCCTTVAGSCKTPAGWLYVVGPDPDAWCLDGALSLKSGPSNSAYVSMCLALGAFSAGFQSFNASATGSDLVGIEARATPLASGEYNVYDAQGALMCSTLGLSCASSTSPDAFTIALGVPACRGSPSIAWTSIDTGATITACLVICGPAYCQDLRMLNCSCSDSVRLSLA